MYAVFSDRGKQVYAQPGETLLVDLFTAEPGSEVTYDQVMLVGGEGTSLAVGKPVLEGVKVVADVVKHLRGKKVSVGTYKRRKNYRKHKGHRQDYTEIRVKEIVTG